MMDVSWLLSLRVPSAQKFSKGQLTVKFNRKWLHRWLLRNMMNDFVTPFTSSALCAKILKSQLTAKFTMWMTSATTLENFTATSLWVKFWKASGVVIYMVNIVIIGLFCKRALLKRLYSAKETCDFKETTNCSQPIFNIAVGWVLENQSPSTQIWGGGGLGSRPKKMYGESLGDGVEYHLMSPTPRR